MNRYEYKPIRSIGDLFQTAFGRERLYTYKQGEVGELRFRRLGPHVVVDEMVDRGIFDDKPIRRRVRVARYNGAGLLAKPLDYIEAQQDSNPRKDILLALRAMVASNAVKVS